MATIARQKKSVAKKASKSAKAGTKAAKSNAPRSRPPPPPPRAPARGFVLERTIEVEVELGGGADTCDVRIDLLRSRVGPTTFRARLWRLERYRIQPTFPKRQDGQPSHEPSDELIMKEWESVPENFDAFGAKDVDAAEADVLDRLDAWLETVNGRAQ